MTRRRWAVLVVVLVAIAGFVTLILIEQRDDACEQYRQRVDELEARLDARGASKAQESRAILRIAREEPDGCDVSPELLTPARL